mmetsp:Transcript_29093/g.33264  ORF Transcript_29093/g.33264 Transcript_29093/m.33264 type:complete len:157 (-) Transcript_29093:119-589(-)
MASFEGQRKEDENDTILKVPPRAFKRNGYAMLNKRPCHLIHAVSSRTGKHGFVKYQFTGLDLFALGKIEAIFRGEEVEAPIVTKKECLVVNRQGDTFLLRDDMEVEYQWTLKGNEKTAELESQLCSLYDGGKEPVFVTLTFALDQFILSAVYQDEF